MLKQMAEKVQELLAAGLSLEEALTQVLTAQVQIPNRIEWIRTLSNIREVRRAIHCAHGKKSKASTPERKDRYQAEIAAGNQRLNELIVQATTQTDPLRGLLAMGEEPSAVLHLWLRTRENKIKEDIRSMAGTIGAKKALVNLQLPTTPDSILTELAQYGLDALYQERVESGDLGVITLNRKTRLLESVVTA